MMKLVSIGPRCQAAIQLQRNGLRDGHYPFDWLISDDFRGVIDAFSTRFAGFFADPQVYDPNPPSVVWDRRYRCRDCHHVGYVEELPVIRDALAQKYRRAVDRLLSLLDLGEPVMLLRCGPELAEDLRDLRAAIAAVYPRASFEIALVNDHASPIDPRLNAAPVRLVHLPLLGHQEQNSTRHDAEWREALLALAGK